MRYLLDTNTVSNMMRDPQGPVFKRLAIVGEKQAFTSILVVSEIRFGIEKRNSRRLVKRFDAVFDVLSVENLSEPADRHYAVLRTMLEAVGKTIGQMDMLIAAHALASNAVLVTDNEKEFSRVPGLKIENWLR